MSSAKRPRSEVSSACTECQRRKGKCTGGRPCSFCTKTHRKCYDQPLVVRTPLTRKNMDDLHDRCERLEALVRSMNPSIDIEEHVGGNSPWLPYQGHVRTDSGAHSAASTGITTPEESPATPDERDGDPGRAGFEWREAPDSDDCDKLADGMASLNIDSRDVGYLGRSSAASLLRHVHRLLKAQPTTTAFTDVLQENLRSPAALRSPSLSPPAGHAPPALPPDEELIDAYFEYHHPSYPLVHEGVFRDEVARWTAGQMAPNTHWRALHTMVLVQGAFMSSRVHRARPVDAVIYKQRMRDLFNVSFFAYGTLEGVQALALMGSYLQKRDNPNTGYNVMGMAVRMAFGLGLHREIFDTKYDTLGMEIRRRVWWTLYMFDVGAGITFGRPTIPSDKVSTKMPLNVIDDDFTDKDTILPPPVDGITKYSGLIAHATMVLIMNKIHLNIFVNPHMQLSALLIHRFDQQLAEWEANLPSYYAAPSADRPSDTPWWFAAPRIVVLWKSQNLRMLMYKCFLDAIPHAPRTFDRDKNPRARVETFVAQDPEVRKCLSFAMQTIQSVEAFRQSQENIWLGVAWYAIYYSFQAALVLVTAVLSAPKDASLSEWKGMIYKAVGVLRSMESVSAIAGRCVAVLDACIKGFADQTAPAATLPNEAPDSSFPPDLPGGFTTIPFAIPEYGGTDMWGNMALSNPIAEELLWPSEVPSDMFSYDFNGSGGF